MYALSIELVEDIKSNWPRLGLNLTDYQIDLACKCQLNPFLIATICTVRANWHRTPQT